MLKSGVPNAIRAFQEVLLPQGITNCAIRLDSGDLTYLCLLYTSFIGTTFYSTEHHGSEGTE